MQWPTQLVAPAIATVASLGTSGIAWRRRRTTGANAVLVCMLGVSLWSAFYTLQWTQTGPTAMRTFDHLIYLGVVLVPVGWLAIAISITTGRRWFTPRRVALLAVEPVLVQVAIWVPSLDHLFFAQQFPQGVAPVSLHLRFGILFWVHSLYSYVLIATGFVLLARARRRAGSALQRQSKTMLLACAFPFVANVISITGASDRGSWFRDYDLTPVGFALTGMLAAWALFGQHLFDLVPVARSLVVDTIGDGVLVTDLSGRVTDANPAVERLFDLVDPTGVRPVVGTDILEVLRTWPQELVDLAAPTTSPADPADLACHVAVETIEGRRDLDARRSAIRDRSVSPTSAPSSRPTSACAKRSPPSKRSAVRSRSSPYAIPSPASTIDVSSTPSSDPNWTAAGVTVIS
jgi:PAS domain-containing protein